jgi:aspartyl-tRNA(Asn)/glutamyl-tRNA(Gln) amidotransferase subunit A
VADQARRYRPIFQAAATRLFDRYDILLAPVAPCTAPRVGDANMIIEGQQVSVRKHLGAYTQPLSYIGLPVLAVPVNRPGQLPIGVQIIAAAGQEDRLFAAAMRLEAQGVVAAHAPRYFR